MCSSDLLVQTSRKGYLAAISASSYSFVSLVSSFGPLLRPNGAFLYLSFFASERIIPGYGGGMSSAKAALESDTVLAAIHASEASDDGVRKLTAVLLRRHGETDARPPQVTCLTSEQLDLALGRSNVIHAALLAGAAGKTFLSRSQILVRYRMADGGKTAGHAARKTEDE